MGEFEIPNNIPLVNKETTMSSKPGTITPADYEALRLSGEYQNIQPEGIDYGLLSGMDINQYRADRQGHWDSYKNMWYRGMGKLALTVPEGIGLLADLTGVLDEERDFNNSLTELSREGKEYLDKVLPEYSRYTEEGGEFNPLNMEFYMRGGDSVLESLGYLPFGYGSGAAVRAGLMSMSKYVPKLAKYANGASAVGAAVVQNQIETSQVAGETMRNLIQNGIDPEEAFSAAQEIKFKGSLLTLLEVGQYTKLFRGFGTTQRFSGIGDSYAKFKMKEIANEMPKEMLEEVGLDFFASEAERTVIINDLQNKLKTASPEEKLVIESELEKLNTKSNYLDRFVDHSLSDEGLTSAFFGGLGAGVTQAGGTALNYGLAKFNGKPTESDEYKAAITQINQNLEQVKDVFKTNTELILKQKETNDPVEYNKLNREVLKNLAFVNAKKGTYQQFKNSLELIGDMNAQEAQSKGFDINEVKELLQVFKKDVNTYENFYNQVTQLSGNENIQKEGFELLSKKYLSDGTITNAQNLITKTYSENTSPTFGPTKQRVNKLVNQQTVFNNFISSIKDTEGPRAEFKQLVQKKLSNVNQQLQQEIENLNNYVDSEFTSDEYAKIRGKKLNENDFKNSLVDNQVQQQEKNLVVAQFESLKAEEEFNNLSNPKVQEQIIQAQQEEIVAQQKQAEKAATKALTDEFNSILNSTNPDVKRLEEINTELKGTSISKDLNNKLAKLKDKLKKAEAKPVVTTAVTNEGETVVPEAVVTQSVEDVFGFNVEYTDNTITATTDSSEVEKVSKEFEGKERAKKQSLTGGYLDVEYVESPDGTLIASLKDEDGNVINVERELDDFIDYNKYPPGTEVTFVIDREWQQQNNIPDSNWWELPIAAQINGKTVFYINKFNAEPTDGIDSNIEKKIATEFQEQVQKELIAQRKDVTTRLLNGESVIGQITNYGTGTIDGYTKDKGKVIDRLGNGTELFKDVAFAVVDKKASKLNTLTDTGDNIVNNSIVTSEAFQSVPNGSVVVLLPSYSRIDGKTELVARPIDRNNLSDTDINIVKHLINTYGKYSREKLNELGLTIPEDVKNVTEYLINNFVYNGRKSGSFFVERVGDERFIKVLDPQKVDSEGNPAVVKSINTKNETEVNEFLASRKYNIHSKPYFNVEFTNEITKITPADSKTTIAERTSTFIDNTTFQVINAAENKMQILRQPSISYNVSKPIESKKVGKQAAKPAKKETTTQVPVSEVLVDALSQYKNEKSFTSAIKNYVRNKDEVVTDENRNKLSFEEFQGFNKAYKKAVEENKKLQRVDFFKQYFTAETKETKSNNNPKQDSLKSTLSSLDNTKLQQLNEIEKSTNPYNALMELIINSKDSDLKNVIFKLKGLNPTIEFTSEISNELAKVVYSDNKIIINKYAVARNPRALEYIVAHEILHLGTLNGLTKNTEFNKKVTELFNFAKSKLDDSYALTNTREFVSEAFTNQEFKEQLKGLEYKGSNVFEKFWSFIKSLFGFNDNVFTLLDKYTNQYLMDFVVNLNGNVVEDNLISDYQIEGLSLQEGYTLVQSMTGLAQDIFRETDINITFAQLKEEIKNRLQAIYDNAVETGELDDDVMLQYEALLADNGDNETFNKLFIRVKANVAYLSDILTKEFDEDINLEDESATVGSESYGREAFQDNPKDKVSLRMKRLLAFIPDSLFNADKTEYFTLENKYGLKEYVPFDVMYNTLGMSLANRPQSEMLKSLETLSTEVANIKVVLDKLEQLRLSDNLDDKALYNEFFSNFSKQHATFVTILFQNNKQNNENKVIFSNRDSAENTLIAKWYNEFKNSYTKPNGIVQIIGNEYKINTEKAKEVYSKYSKADQIKDNKQRFNAYREVLNEIGINVNEGAVNVLLKDPKMFGYKNTSDAMTAFRESVSFVITRLNNAPGPNDGLDTFNNPFINTKKGQGEKSNLELLASMQLKVDTNLLSSMFRNEEGKNIYTIFNNNTLSQIHSKLQFEDTRKALVNTWKNSAFHKDNHIIKQIIDGDLDANTLKLVLVSTMAQDKKSNSGKPYKNLTAQERQVAKLIAWLNSGNKIGYIQFPTQSDKPTIPFLGMPKMNVEVKDGKLNPTALDAVYSIFLQEANRIIKANQDYNNLKDTNFLITNYHLDKKGKHDTSNSQKFMMLPLNDLKITTENTGVVTEQSLRDTLINQGITENVELQVKEKLNEIALQYIESTKQFYDSLGITQNGKIKDKFYTGKQDSDIIAAYTINHMIGYASIFSIYNNDPAYSKDIDDVSKRGAMNLAPGQDLFDVTSGTYNSLIIKDVIFKSKNYQAMLDFFTKHFNSKEKAEQFLEPFKDINGTDAQAYVSLDFFEKIMDKLGRLDNDLKDLIDKARQGTLDGSEIEVLQPLKLVYVNDVWDTHTQNYVRKYIKFSAFPLYPQLTQPNGKPNELDSFRLDMENKKVDFVAFESASKLGSQGIQPMYNEVGQLQSIQENNVIELPLEGMRLQQEVPFDADKKEVNVVSQARKLLFGDLLDPAFETNYTFGDKTDLSVRELKEIFDSLHEANVTEKFESLKKELGLTVDNEGNYFVTNLEALKDILSDELVRRQNNDNILEGLELIEEESIKKFKIPLYFSPNNQSFESVLLSIVSNNIIKQKQAGKSFVQGSEFGFYDVVTKIPEQYKDSIEWIRQNNNSLDPLTVKDNKLEPEGVLLPNIYRSILKEGQEIPQELLKVFGFRIPNQGHNSMSPLKIQGFLPAAAGDLVIVTPEMLKRMGSDFDVDKLFIYFYNVKQTKDGLKKVEYSTSEKELTQRYKTYKKGLIKSLIKRDEETNIVKLYEDSLDTFIEEVTKTNAFYEISQQEFNFINSRINEIKDKIKVSEKAEKKELYEVLDELYSEIIFYSKPFRDQLLKKKEAEEIKNEWWNYFENKYNSSILTEQEFSELPIELQNTKQARQNAILDIYFEIFSKPALLEKIMVANDIEPLVKAVVEVMGEETIQKDILTVETQDNYFEANSGGKSGVGVTSLWSTFFAQIQYYNVAIKGQGILFKDDKGETIRLKDSKGNYLEDDGLGLTKLNNPRGVINNSFISNILQLFQSAAVDNAKEQILDKVGLNNDTFDVAQLIAYSGIDDLKTIISFLRQPIIEKYISFIQRSRTRFADFSKGSYEERAAEQALAYINNNLKEAKINYNKFSETTKPFSYSEMKEFIELSKKEATKKLNVKSYKGNIKPEPNTIFVFGSNPEGRHGAGAAKIAKEQFGAIYGQGEGLQGNAYALPTKDLRIKENKGLKSISSEQIINNIEKLYNVAKENPDKEFKIGYRNTNEISLNGYTGLEMIDMFIKAGKIPSNIIFSEEWVNTEKFIQQSLTAEEKVKYFQGQFQILSNFIQYKDKAKVLGKAITAYNIDTKSVGINYYEVLQAVNKYDTYFNAKEVPFFDGLQSMNTGFVKSLYDKGLKLAQTAFNQPSILPFNNKFFKKLYQNALEITGKEELNAQDVKLLNKTALWYITSLQNGVINENVQELRKRLLTSVIENNAVKDKSLALRIQDLKNEGYDNWLVERLVIDNDNIKYYRNNLEKSEEVLAVISFIQLLNEHPEIGKELIQYSYLTSGGNPTATGFNNIIPVTELNEFGKYYNSKEFQDLLNDDSFSDIFFEQFYRNNPTKAYNISELNPVKLEGKNIQVKSEDALPKYVYMYVKQENAKAITLIFKKNPNYKPSDNVYYSLGLLNNEYAGNTPNLESIYPDNNKYISQPIKNNFENKNELKDKLDNVSKTESTLGKETDLIAKEKKC
jgi:hypothetical protein